VNPRPWTPATIVNLARYPIADLASAGAKAVIAEGRAQLARTGLCLFPEFVTAAALAAMAAEANALAGAIHHETTWMRGSDVRDGALHRPTRNACGSIPYDRIPTHSPSRVLYEWDGLAALFRELLGLEAFYRCADPISSCLLMYYGDDDELGWHFDPNDGVATLLVQAASEGGAFEYAPGIGRDPARFDPILDGGREGVVVPDLRPGTLSLFRGRNALHRVTPTSGPRPRVMLTMSFDERPNMVFSPENRRRYSGRIVDESGATLGPAPA
jgi:alkylated DNA repair dioxygenase AlkB